MKLRHIYINKEGEPMANPYMEYPKKPDKNMKSEDGMFDWTVFYVEHEQYMNSLLPFEDAMKIFPLHVRLTDIKPDTLIPVDLEVEVVEIRTLNGKPCGDGPIIPNEGDCLDFTNFPRIKN